MSTVRRTRAELAATGFRFDAVERARLDAMSDEEIERLAREDPDNPPLTDQELSRMVAARSVRRVREGLGLTQGMFAEQYRINPARLRDWEQGRSTPDSAALAYLRVIEREPEAVARALSVE
jgi:putative transcriptional regulator